MNSLSEVEVKLIQHSFGLSSWEQSQPPTAASPLNSAADLIVRGSFLTALTSHPLLTALLDARGDDTAVQDPESYYSLVASRAAAAVSSAVDAEAAAAPVRSEETGTGAAAVAAGAGSAASTGASTSSPPAAAVAGLHAVLLAGVASLHLFTQHNLTGPSCVGAPPSPLDFFAPGPVAQHSAQPPPRPPPSVAAAAIAAITQTPADHPTDTPAPASSSPAGASEAAVAPGGSGDAAVGAAAADGASSAPSAPQADGLAGLGVDSQSRGDRWAAEHLQLDGEDLVGRCPAVQWLLLARTLLLAPLGLLQPGGAASQAPQPQPHHDSAAGVLRSPAQPLPRSSAPLAAVSRVAPSWPCWGLRAVLSHQHALDGRSHSLLSEASQLIQALLAPGALAAAAGGTGAGAATVAAAVAGVLHVEMALCQYVYGYVEAGRQYLGRAGQLLGMEPQLTGALGKRTVHQVDPKAQLVVVASESARSAPPYQQYDTAVDQLGLEGVAPGNPELQGLADESEVFAAPVLVGEDGKLLETRYSSPEQALLLAGATAVQKGTSADDLQEWQMAPWVEAVLTQRRSCFMAAAAARLHKTRHERSRGRTRERALLHFDQLAEAVAGAEQLDSGAAAAAEDGEGQGQGTGPTEAPVGAPEAAATDAAARSASAPGSSRGPPGEELAGRRAVLSWAVWFPLQVSLRREAAELYVSMGLVGAAIRVFESLELWDAVITCYRLIGKKALAEELIKRRLAVTPDDPRLWCALGDLHMDDRYYEEAWERSGRRHTRSQRSLARSAMGRKDYPRAARHWETALALNPLHPEAWFALGFCYLRAEKHREALRAFTRVTQQEPDNGEAWNNIAALWMYLGGYKPAFAALSESVKHKRDSWQTWENYARAALASGHYQQAVRGLQNSLRLSSGQRLFVDVVSGLLDVLEGRPPPRDGGTSLRAAKKAAAEGLTGLAAEGEAEEGSGAAAAEGGGGSAVEDDSLKEDEAALGVPLLPLLSDVPLPPSRGSEDEPAVSDAADANQPSSQTHTQHPQDAAGPQGSKQAEGGSSTEALLFGREREVVLAGVGALLREAVNSPAASPVLWGCLGRYWALRGEVESAKEARLKQVRGLASGAFKSDPAKFVEYAVASEALCRCYEDCFRQGKPGALKDLAAGRMHLRGLIRSTAETFEDHAETAKLKALLDEITKLEDDAIAANKAAKEAS